MVGKQGGVGEGQGREVRRRILQASVTPSAVQNVFESKPV